MKLAQANKLRVGCHKEIKNIIGNHPNIEFVLFTPFKTEKMGEYEIIPLLANHMDIMNENSCSFHYIIKTFDSKTVFYGLDGAWFLRPSWEIMKKQKFDIMVMDCTVGDMNDWRFCEHNTIPMLRIMADGIRTSGMLLENGKIVASHFARTLHVSHEDTREVLEQMDVITAYDAMALEF